MLLTRLAMVWRKAWRSSEDVSKFHLVNDHCTHHLSYSQLEANKGHSLASTRNGLTDRNTCTVSVYPASCLSNRSKSRVESKYHWLSISSCEMMLKCNYVRGEYKSKIVKAKKKGGGSLFHQRLLHLAQVRNNFVGEAQVGLDQVRWGQG